MHAERRFHRRLAATSLLLAAGVSACAPSAAPAPAVAPATSIATPAAASAVAPLANRTRVRAASQGIAGDAPAVVAAERGYFAQEGLDFEFVRFSNASEMIPALATGQVEVSAMSGNPALWNAVARGIDVKVTLDMITQAPGHGSTALVIRKDLYDAGRGRSLNDLVGLDLAITPPGKATVSACAVAAGLQRVGLTLDDLNIQSLTFPDMVPALANGSIDGGILAEPFLARARRQGSAVRVMGLDEMYPYFNLSQLGFATSFYNDRPAAKAFARAYIRAGREYLAAVTGRSGEAERAQIDEMIARHTGLDAATVHEMVPSGLNPNGLPNVDSMLYCYQFFRDQGLIPTPVSEAAFASLWGTELVEEVLGEIGRVQ